MTEAAWLACNSPEPMYSVLQGMSTASERRWYLFACACLRDYRVRVTERREYRGVTVWINATEGYVDGLVTQARWESAGTRCGWAHEGSPHGHAAWTADAAANAVSRGDPTEREGQYRREADMVRDIFGNPFRHVIFCPSWRTSTAVSLTRQIYDSRDFSAMPILADALQDAGCEDEQLLGHCRGPGPHVRGCWAIDLVLGKG